MFEKEDFSFFAGRVISDSYLAKRHDIKKHEITGEAEEMMRDFIFYSTLIPLNWVLKFKKEDNKKCH